MGKLKEWTLLGLSMSFSLRRPTQAHLAPVHLRLSLNLIEYEISRFWGILHAHAKGHIRRTIYKTEQIDHMAPEEAAHK